MPFDGILTNSIAEELNQRLLGGRIEDSPNHGDALSFKSELLEKTRPFCPVILPLPGFI